jgi:hypothetical protein
MPLVAVIWFLLSLGSLAIWGGAAYLLWSYFDAEWMRTTEGALVRDREEWRLWTGLGLLAWSLLGRFVVTPLIAKPDRRPRHYSRGKGRSIQSGEGELYLEDRGDPNACGFR